MTVLVAQGDGTRPDDANPCKSLNICAPAEPAQEPEPEPESNLPAIVRQYDADGSGTIGQDGWLVAVDDYVDYRLTAPEIRQMAAHRGWRSPARACRECQNLPPNQPSQSPLPGQQGEESSPTRGRAPSQQNPPPVLHNLTVRGQVPEPCGDPQRRRAHDDLSGWPGTRPATNPAESVVRTPLRRRAHSHYDIFQKERMAGCASTGESRCTLRWAIYRNRHVVKTTMKARFCCVRADPAGGVKSCRDVCGGVFCRKRPAPSGKHAQYYHAILLRLLSQLLIVDKNTHLSGKLG